MILRRSIREDLPAALHAYTFLVLGLLFGITGAAGLLVSDRSGIRVAALIGSALGFLVALYLP